MTLCFKLCNIDTARVPQYRELQDAYTAARAQGNWQVLVRIC